MNVKCTFWEKTDKLKKTEYGLSPIYKNAESGEEADWDGLPIGAMYYAPEDWGGTVGPDGKMLCVKVPGERTWYPDSRASNCTKPDDNEHRCWVRHGVPPNITVDKNGNTCAAGAGSILIGDYHGFLRNGELTDCP